MRGLNERLRERWPGLPVEPRPLCGSPAVIPTHDLDFLAGRPDQSAVRFAKNAVVPLVRGDARAARSVASSARRLGRGQSPLDCLPWLVDQESRKGVPASWFVLCRRSHRRDANYDLEERRTQEVLDHLAGAGAPVGVHGSYTSLEEPGRLAASTTGCEPSASSRWADVSTGSGTPATRCFESWSGPAPPSIPASASPTRWASGRAWHRRSPCTTCRATASCRSWSSPSSSWTWPSIT